MSFFFGHCQCDKGDHKTETCTVNWVENLNNFLYNEANLVFILICNTLLISELKLAWILE